MTEPIATGPTYGVELLFDAPYDLAAPALVAALSAECPRAEVEVKRGGVSVVHSDVKSPASPELCARAAILGTDAPVDPDVFAPVVAQSRAWPGAGAAVARARHRLLVTDVMAAWMPPALRLEVFQRVLVAAVRALRPCAISWVPAGKLVEPGAFLAALASSDPQERALTGLNVRLFQFGERAGECVMDTLGLGALGLTDLQIHFVGLEPNAVARHLFNTALHVLDRGDVLDDGHTLQGLDPSQKWGCGRASAIVGPKRDVITMHPGAPFAAGEVAP